MNALRFAAFAVALCVVGQAAHACINDKETPRYEEEFQKQYQPEPEYRPGEPVPWHLAGLGLGGTLAGSAIVIATRRGLDS